MTTDLLEQRLRNLAVTMPDPARISARVLTTPVGPEGRRHLRIALAPVAVLAVAALVAYFVPAADTAVANVPFAGDLLRDAGLAGVGDRITSVGAKSTSSGYTLTLVGAYADSTRTVLLIRSDPAALSESGFPTLTDQFGRTYQPHGGTGDIRTGEQSMEFDALAWPDDLTGARITLHITTLDLYGPDYRPRGRVNGSWVLSGTVGVDQATSLPLPAPASTGSIQYRFTTVTYTPATILIDMVITGTSEQEISNRIPGGGKGTPVFTIDLVDPNGEVINGTWSIGEDPAGVHVHFLAYRQGASGVHTLRITYAGQGTFERTIRVP